MRITESKLRSIVRSVIAESKRDSLNESMLSKAKESFKSAVKNIFNMQRIIVLKKIQTEKVMQLSGLKA